MGTFTRQLFNVLSVILFVIAATVFFLHFRGSLKTPLPAPVNPPAWEVYFSPDGGCTEAITQAVDDAQRTVLVQAYSFTSAPIAKALAAAKRRGVAVRVILDQSQRSERYSSATFLAHANIPTYIDAQHAIAHNKVMVIDERTVITGSFNFTKAAETRNAENLLILHDPVLAARYTANWQAHLQHSELYTGM